MQAAWDRLEERLTILGALANRAMDWSEVYAEADLPPGPCKQTAAIELAESECTELRRELLTAGRAG